MAEAEISSILDSELPPDKKSAFLASYLSEDEVAYLLQSNTRGSSSGITVQVQEKSDHKKADAKNNAPPEKIKIKASSSSSGVELQVKNKHTDEVNSKEEHDRDEESASKESSLSRPSSHEEKGQDVGAKAKEEENDHLHCKDEKSEVQDDDKSLSHPMSQQAKTKTKTKTKGALDDPLTGEEISSILTSNLSTKEKLSLLILSNLNEVEIPPSETKTSTSNTPLKVELKENIQHTETEVKRDVEDDLPSDDRKLRKIDERLSHSSPPQEEQAKVDDPNLKLSPDGKSQSLVYDRNKVDGPSSKLNSSSSSSRIEFNEKDQQHVEMEGKDEHDNGSIKCIHEAGSSFRSQRVHVEDYNVTLELKQEFVIARVEEPRNINGEEDEKIHREEVVCKYCYKNMIDEENVLKAKCKCKLTLIHEECATKWSAEKGNKCTACEEEIRNIHVTIVMASSLPSQTDVEKLDKPTASTRCWSCLFNF